MQVKFLGFSVRNESKNISQDDFYGFLVKHSGMLVAVGEHDRYVYFDDSEFEGFVVGLVLTLKDQKKFCKADVQRGSFTVNTEDVVGGKLADFNFFVINKVTRKGIYQYYHQSCSATGFGDLCKIIHRREKEDLIKKEFDSLLSESNPDEDVAKRKAAKNIQDG